MNIFQAYKEMWKEFLRKGRERNLKERARAEKELLKINMNLVLENTDRTSHGIFPRGGAGGSGGRSGSSYKWDYHRPPC